MLWINKSKLAGISLLLLVLMVPESGVASDPGSFKHFYTDSNIIGWVVAAVVALVAGLVIFFTGGAASPIVVSVGTAIGNMAGLSGIAATNYGLALLGGGAVTAGGLGIAGGVALLTAALTFSTEVVINYAVSEIKSAYNYQKLVEQSRTLAILPPPQRTSGPEPYENSLEILEGFKKEQPHFSNANQAIFRKAIVAAYMHVNDPDQEDLLQIQTLLAYLYLATNQYKLAVRHAEIAIHTARQLNFKSTLPAFIYAIGVLYQESMDFSDVNKNYFQHSVLAEPKNDLIPLVFSIYTSHIELRFRGNTHSYYDHIRRVSTNPQLKPYATQNYSILMVNYIKSLKIEQQRISSLSTTDNETIRSHPSTLKRVQTSMEEYQALLKGAGLVQTFSQWEKKKPETLSQFRKFKKLLFKYRDDTSRLNGLITSLQSYQESRLATADPETIAGQENKEESSNIVTILASLLLLSVIGLMAVRRFRR
jgi:hypothetical protein